MMITEGILVFKEGFRWCAISREEQKMEQEEDAWIKSIHERGGWTWISNTTEITYHPLRSEASLFVDSVRETKQNGILIFKEGFRWCAISREEQKMEQEEDGLRIFTNGADERG